MTTHRRYTKRQKAELVGQAEVAGLRATAEAAGVPVSTLESWRQHPDFAQLRIEKREDVAADVWAGFQKGVRRVAQLFDTTDDIAKAATATGILYDKFALMSGLVTNRSEHVTATEGLDDHEKAALRRAIDEWLAEVPT